MSSEPITEFQSIDESIESLYEWQHRLFLDDWIIKIKLCDPDDMELENVAGEVNWQFVNRTAIIRIRKDVSVDEYISKVLHEKTLVHELLHIKFAVDYPADETIENVSYYHGQHALMEQLAKSLIMAKYNLPFEWFKNF